MQEPKRPVPDSPRLQAESSMLFPVVGVGASAGGLAAFERFFSALPDEPGIAFVVIQHLAPTHESSLPELLQKHTAMTVEAAHDGTTVEPGCVYVIPPGKRLTIRERTLQLDDPERPHGQRAFIDQFFRSLASDQGERAACVILSGTGADGSMGLRSIKENGGAVLVQKPSEADHDGMPRSAVATGQVDIVAPADELARTLIEYHRSADRIQLPDDSSELPDSESDALKKILKQLKRHTGYDFSKYKETTILRRIKRRMQVHQVTQMSSYLTLLREDESEAPALMKDFLISVTNFFRDPESFKAFEEQGLPTLFEGKQDGDPMRVWVPGCATGEEAYSIAMLLCEEADRQNLSVRIQVFASDLDEDALEHARHGLYPDVIAADLSPERLARFFDREQDGYRVHRSLQEIVLFTKHDLLSDPPFSKLDLISCRNLLIYLQREIQGDLFRLFHYALREDGILFLGNSETTDSASDLFRAIDKKHRFYRRRAGSSRLVLPPLGSRNGEDEPDRDERRKPSRSSLGEAHRDLMLEAYAPPSVLVDEEYQICYLFGAVGRYIRASEGEPTHNLLELVQSELRVELRAALFQIFKKENPTQERQVRLELDGEPHLVNLVVRPVRRDEFSERLALVIFEPAPADDDLPEPAVRDSNGYDREAVEQLESELKHTKQRLSTVIEEYETSNEELKASNEELQSMNEELRSTTEELETSKEELQSTNEELETVNFELKKKVGQLKEVNSDLENLMASTHIASLFLGGDLRLKRYTPAATRLFNIIPADIGRPFRHITHKVDHEDLTRYAEQVLDHLEPIEKEIRGQEGGTFRMRMTPYRTVDDRIDGVVATFVDVSEQKRMREEEKRRARRALTVAELRHQALEGVPPTDLMESAVARVAHILDVEFCKVLELCPKEQLLLLRAGVGWKKGLVGEARVETASHSQAGYTLTVGNPVVVDNLEEEQRFSGPKLLTDHGVVSGISVVVAGTDEPYGVLGAHTRRQRSFTEEEVQFLQSIADVIGMTIERYRAEEALRESEARYRRIVTTANEGIWVVDSAGSTRYANEKMAAMLGCTLDELNGKALWDFILEEDLDEVMVQREVRREGLRDAFDARYRRIDGSILWAHVTTSPIYDQNGEFDGAFAMFTDITDRKEAEETLRELNDHLEARVERRTRQVRELASSLTMAEQEERRRISQILHDDLQQLLYGMQLKLHIAQQAAQDGDLDKLQSCIDETDSWIRDSVELTRSLTVNLSPPVLQNEGLVETLVWLQDQMKELHDLEIEIDSAEALPPIGDDMRVLLFQVVRELLFNVAKHSEARHASVALREQEGRLQVIVSDEGTGFDVQNAREREKASFGLFSVRERLSLFGGTMRIDSAPGEGTTVTISVPSKETEQPD